MSVLNRLARTPPMGWNSYDCFGMTVTEDEVKANADFMAEKLARFGWNYIVIDIRWYDSRMNHKGYDAPAMAVLDEYGRFAPAPNKYPSCQGGRGMAPLADYVHKKGLKFGIHRMRGIPRAAVEKNLPVIGTSYSARDIADTSSVCHWNADCYGLKPDHPGSQAYYNAIARLYAYWGVDFIKVDDMASPFHAEEIDMFSRAITGSGQEMILSLSPGDNAEVKNADFLKERCELYRISGDVWDFWAHIQRQLNLCAQWTDHTGPGRWADADMLPLGRIGIRSHGGDRMSRLTEDEQRCMMTLWAIFRSPLMMGGHLPDTDDFALSLMTNEEVIAVNQRSRNNREILRDGNTIIWRAEASDSGDVIIAVFNTEDHAETKTKLNFHALDIPGPSRARDLWARRDVGEFKTGFTVHVPPHGAGLYRMTPAK